MSLIICLFVLYLLFAVGWGLLAGGVVAAYVIVSIVVGALQPPTPPYDLFSGLQEAPPAYQQTRPPTEPLPARETGLPWESQRSRVVEGGSSPR